MEEEENEDDYIDEDDLEEVPDDDNNGDIPMDEEEDDDENIQLNEDGEVVKDDSIYVFRGHTKNEPIYAVSVSHKGNSILSGGGDDSAYLWNQPSNNNTQEAPLLLVGKHSDSVVAVGFSYNDEWIATGGMDGIIQVVNIRKEEKYTLEGPGSEIEWISWHPSHLIVLAGSTDTTTWMWNIQDKGALMGVFAGHTDSVTCGNFTPNGRRIVTTSLDGTLKLWDPNNSTCIHTFNGHGFHHGAVVALTNSNSDPFVATGGDDGTVCLTRLDTKKIIVKFVHAEEQQQQSEEEEGEVKSSCSVEAISFCQKLPWLVSGGTDGRVIVWDLSVQAKRSVLVHPDAVVKLLFLPDSLLMVTACADGIVRKYDARASSLEKMLTGHTQAILDMALFSDHSKIVTASDDGTCRVFLI